MGHETKIALSDNKNKRFVRVVCLLPVGWRLCVGWVSVYCQLSASLLLVECPWRSSSGTQLSERPEIKQIATEVPLEGFQRHLTGRKARNQANCRGSAAGGTPGALNRQKAHKSNKLPPKCPWNSSKGTTAAEQPTNSPTWPERLSYFITCVNVV